jgi:hypothetical protein
MGKRHLTRFHYDPHSPGKHGIKAYHNDDVKPTGI